MLDIYLIAKLAFLWLICRTTYFGVVMSDVWEGVKRYILRVNMIVQTNNTDLTHKKVKLVSKENKGDRSDGGDTTTLVDYDHDYNYDYDIEKVYAVRINHIGKDVPNGDLKPGFIWLNTMNNTLNVYDNGSFHEFPVQAKSIIKKYIRVTI